MIIKRIHGNLFESSMQTLVNPVNTVKVMGAGLALAFKIKYPGLFDAYVEACEMDVFVTHGFFVYDVSPKRKILCLPTKHNWRQPSQLSWIDDSLQAVHDNYADYGITSIAIPPIGCGRGGLNFSEVEPLIHKWLEPISIPVEIYVP